MGILSSIKKQFIDVIHRPEDDDEVLVARYPMQDFEIQSGAQLTVRDGQAAVFVNEGKVADVFGQGLFKLTTQTLPVLTALKNWDKLFESPFKSDVYFVSTRLQLGRKWGTPQAVTIRDQDFGMVRVRAFGIYSYRIVDAGKFYSEISGARETYTRTDFEQQLRNLVVSAMSAAIGEAKMPFLDMAANQPLMAEKITEHLKPLFARYGCELDSFAIENLNLPEEVQKAVDLRSTMGAIGSMQTYTQYQTANAIKSAAENEGGIAGLTAQMGMGLHLGQTIAAGLGGSGLGGVAQPAPVAPAAPAAPAAATASAEDPEAKLTKLKALKDKGLISEAQFEAAQAEILKKLID